VSARLSRAYDVHVFKCVVVSRPCLQLRVSAVLVSESAGPADRDRDRDRGKGKGKGKGGGAELS
jgi:hypothetical protein